MSAETEIRVHNPVLVVARSDETPGVFDIFLHPEANQTWKSYGIIISDTVNALATHFQVPRSEMWNWINHVQRSAK